VDLLLIRHGQSTNNLLWERTGSSRGRSADAPLTTLGRQQATALAESLARNDFGVRPTHLFTSLMTRAVQTAAPIAQALDLALMGRGDIFEFNGPIEIDERTGERTASPGAGRESLQRISSRLVLPDSATDRGWWSGPVEDEAGCALRARDVVRDLLTEFDGADATPALVSHATFGQCLTRHLLGIESMTGWIRIDNTSVSYFTGVLGPSVAAWLNRTTHLRVDQVSG
jgi:2,3-bisphosphoglycerate-dependent phosphoglycerate mutase